MLEKQLISKMYYRTLISEGRSVHPIQQLGELFEEEQKKEFPDASNIRFAQGEVYYHNKDYEAAIFKWENVHNGFTQWAKKNIADAYMELGIYQDAETIYLSVETDSLTLRTEVLLQLFSLYIQQEQFKRADETIKQTVQINPDYPNVTKLARAFFEKQEDWYSAIELAIQEGIRTKEKGWFELLKKYIQDGYAKQLDPTFFFQALKSVLEIEPVLFEQLMVALWENYESEKETFQWVKEINTFLKESELPQQYQWRTLSQYYKKTYHELMDGNYSLHLLRGVIPNYLHAWMKIVVKEDAILPSSAIFAWNEMVPDQFSPDLLQIAEKTLFNAEMNVDVMDRGKELQEAIEHWTENHQLNQNLRLQMLATELTDFTNQMVGVICFNEDDKSSFAKQFLQTDILSKHRDYAVSFLKDGNEERVIEFRDYHKRELTIEEFNGMTSRTKGANICYEVQLSNGMLKNNHLTFIDFPSLNRVPVLNDSLKETLRIVDTLLVVIGENGVSEAEQEWIESIPQLFPQAKTYLVYNGGNLSDIVVHDPKFERIYYENTNEQRDKLAALLQSSWDTKDQKQTRIKSYLYVLRKIMDNLLDQREKIESQLIDTVQQKEDLAQRVNGAIYQLQDLTNEKVNMIKKSFMLVKEETKKEMMKEIPIRLKDTAKMVTKKRDFQRIHIELNQEMNDRIQQYLNEEVMPEFLTRITDWLTIARTELNEGRMFLEEINQGFNTMIGQERLQLTCDYKILEDWQRDIDRLTSRINYEPVNILLRYTPKQVLLKSAGKVFGRMIQNKDMLANGFKQLIENGNYEQEAETIANRFFNPFLLLEQGIERDLQLFFKDAFEELQILAEETNREITETTGELKNLRGKPELFHDPLKIFEITRLQYKYIVEIKEMSLSYIK